MSRLRWITAGESHGPKLTAVVDGIPSGLTLLAEDIDHDLARRQRGYGRGGRMKIETDRVEITSGVRGGETLGSPITLSVANRYITPTGSTACLPALTHATTPEMRLRGLVPGTPISPEA